MDFFELLFGGGEAIQSIFQLGFIPKEEDFREFSSVENNSSTRKSVTFAARCIHSIQACLFQEMIFMLSARKRRSSW